MFSCSDKLVVQTFNGGNKKNTPTVENKSVVFVTSFYLSENGSGWVTL